MRYALGPLGFALSLSAGVCRWTADSLYDHWPKLQGGYPSSTAIPATKAPGANKCRP
jgi:hypothetical protein